jgi:hypothetical protein
VSNTTELQRLILPDLGVCPELDLYARCEGAAAYAYRRGELKLAAGGRVSFATLYGAFSIGKWRRLAGISSLRLRLDISGEGQVVIWTWRDGQDRRYLASAEVPASGGVALEIPLATGLEGIIAPEVTAWGPMSVRGGAWETDDAPRRDVKLGMVITTFQREAAVKESVRRLVSGMLSDISPSTQLVVVDNGRTLAPDDVPGATLVPNPNLGGAGGFARGLCWLQDAGDFTHAVFMDDDASAELESIRRAVNFLRYVSDDRTAMVSGLLFEEYPGIQLEAAGQMPGDVWMPARPGVDLRKTKNLVANELPFRVDYGGWWMFFFPLMHVRNLPFPFFVRGDDVEFPRANDFVLVTLNGVNSFGPDFFRKESPVNVALDRRGNLVNVLLHGSGRSAVRGVVRGLEKGLAFANRYCYDHVDALCEGTLDVLGGPSSFEDLSGFADGRRKEFAACARQRRLAPDKVAGYATVSPRPRGFIWHGFRLLLLNGHVLPRFMLRRRPVVLGTVWEAPGSEAFLRPFVLVREGLSGTLIFAERDVRRYFLSLTRLAWLSIRLLAALPRLQGDFRRARGEFGSRSYWERQFQRNPPAADVQSVSGGSS